MATSRQEYVATIAGLRGRIDAAWEQREKYPENSVQWNAFDDQIVDLMKQVVTNSIDFDRPLAERIVGEFNLTQESGLNEGAD